MFGCFAAYGLCRAPVPAVNEPHYLGKARHFWNPGWCARDLFLDSADAHWVFYATVGALTRWLSLPQTAVVGRTLAWILLASGWVAFVSRIVPSKWGSICAAVLFLAVGSYGNLSGEWLIGGVESKCFAYAALFFALAAAFDRRWRAAAVAMGISISFHPVVGGWGVIAGAFAVAWQNSGLLRSAGAHGETSTRAPPHVSGLAAVCLICSLPGLIPAVAMLAQPAPAEVRRQADEIQVFDRLDHHLDPRQFPARAWVEYGVLLAAWLAFRPWRSAASAGPLFFGFVAGALLIAAAGAVVGFGPRWAGLLKFYPFRLADLLLPVAVAVAGSDALVRISTAGPANGQRSWQTAVLPATAVVAFGWAMLAPVEGQDPGGLNPDRRAAWRDVCAWVGRETPRDALFLTPRYSFAFKWYANRAEYATWKDCPQDATSLVEWKRRLDEIRDWRKTWFERGFSGTALANLRERTGVDYVVDWRVYPYRTQPVYANAFFAVFAVGKAPSDEIHER